MTQRITLLPQTQQVPDDVYAQAADAFTEDQYRILAWAITVINALNRISVTSRKRLPRD